MTKVCAKCQEVLPLSEFHKNRSRRDGLQAYCKSCNLVSKRNWQKQNTEKVRSTKRAWRANNVEKERARVNDWRQANPEKYLEGAKAYREANPEKVKEATKVWRENNVEKVQEYSSNWKKENSEKSRVYEAKRRASKLQRSPAWADLDAIQKIYDECPEGYHVDHIIPLQGDMVSGLHVENNLRPIPAKENMRKGNKLRGVNNGY